MRIFVILACVCALGYAQIQSDDAVNTNVKDEFQVEETADAFENKDFSVGGASQDNTAAVQEASDVGSASQDGVVSVQESSDVGAASQNDAAAVQEASDVGVASQDVALKETSDVGAANTASLSESANIEGEGQSNDGEVNVIPNSDAAGGTQSENYEVAADQYESGSAPRPLSSRCIEKNERYAIPGSCDKYIECLNGTAEEKVCPDGLRYNPNVKFNVYPCQYPIDVPCLGRAALQPAQPTADCPHQFGYFKSGDSRNCGTFKNCVNGVGYDFNCPEGLAFSSDTYRCEWPDLVSDCDAEAFLGFRCPEVPISKELGPPAGFRFYRSPEDCQKYFICIDGKPRRLACGGYTAFDELSESCVAADEISACPQELRSRAELSRKAESQRLTAENIFERLRKEELTTIAPSSEINEELSEPEVSQGEEAKQDIENDNADVEKPQEI